MSRSGAKCQGQMSGERIAGIWKSGAGKERRKRSLGEFGEKVMIGLSGQRS